MRKIGNEKTQFEERQQTVLFNCMSSTLRFGYKDVKNGAAEVKEKS